MQTKKIIIIKSNLIERDSRMLKEAKSLKQSGYKITILSWDRNCEASKNRRSNIEDYEEISLRFKAPWGINVLPLLPIWWCFVFFQLIVKQWDIVHVINLDSMISAIAAGKLRRKPVIYEIEDTYVDQTVLPKTIRSIGIQVDKIFIRLSTAIILIDENQIKEFEGIPNPLVIPIYDTPPTFNNICKETCKDDVFTIYYTGYFSKARRMNIDKFILAIKTIDNVKLVISGQGYQNEEIQNWAKQIPEKMTFLGFISSEEVLLWSYKANLLLVARTPFVVGNRYNCGSTVLRALMFGKPFIANKGTATASLIDKEHCGITVDSNNVDEIRQAIITLKDNPSLCKEYGANAKKAYEQQYNWEIMEQKLFNLYHLILNNNSKEESIGNNS
jgi:glycosyltransferase involved in cell wall biosynthesis